MNKFIVGGLLVTVMGGVPGATYLLTRDPKITTSSSQEKETSNLKTPSDPARSGEDSAKCPKPESEGVCPPAEA